MLDYIRGLSRGLRPPELERLGLDGALLGLAERGRGLRVEYANSAPLPFRLDKEVELHLYRIAQEAPNNVVRHAQARSARISLEEGPGSLLLSVEDDGSGFDQGLVKKDRRSGEKLGIAGMRERASIIGAELRIASVAGSGTRITIEVPHVR